MPRRADRAGSRTSTVRPRRRPVTDGDQRLCVLPGLRADRATPPTARSGGGMPLGPFNMFYGFGASPILGRRHAACCRSIRTPARTCSASTRTPGKQRWKSRSPRRHLRLFDADGLPAEGRRPTQILIPESFQLSAYAPDGRQPVWWVRGLACEMKSVASIDGDTAYINGWGFPQNQPGTQVANDPLRRGAEALRQERRRPRRADESHRRPSRWTRCSSPATVPGVRLRSRRQARRKGVGRVSRDAGGRERAARDQAGRQGRHDRTARSGGGTSARCRRCPRRCSTRACCSWSTTAASCSSIDPATGNVLKQGRLKGAIDKYFASPVGADGKVFLVSQDGTASVVDAHGRLGDPLGQPARRRGVRHAGDCRRQDLPAHEEHALLLRHRDHAVDRDRYDLGWPIA